MIKFYIIYSIDVPINEYDSKYSEYTTKELYDTCIENGITTPFKYEKFSEKELVEENLEGYTENEIFEMYYGDYNYELFKLIDNHFRDETSEDLIENNVSSYILNNLDKFKITESDNFSDEFNYADLNTCHRKYVAVLNQDEFLEFIYNFSYCSTCDTMGSMTEFVILPAFNVEIGGYNIENLYISLLFNEKLENEVMIQIENNIREAIEKGYINEEMFKIS